MAGLKIDMKPIAPYYADVLDRCTRYNIAVYDACYLVLAEIIAAPLVTSDRKFFHAARKNEWIRWIGDI